MNIRRELKKKQTMVCASDCVYKEMLKCFDTTVKFGQ